jgi:hypothetical protein
MGSGGPQLKRSIVLAKKPAMAEVTMESNETPEVVITEQVEIVEEPKPSETTLLEMEEGRKALAAYAASARKETE